MFLFLSLHHLYFNPPAPHGTGPELHKQVVDIIQFQSTRPSQDGTTHWQFSKTSIAFQSTRPSRDGTTPSPSHACQLLFQSTRPLTGRDVKQLGLEKQLKISIHPPLTGRDSGPSRCCLPGNYFNPPAPHGTGLVRGIPSLRMSVFQSTRPSRDGTNMSFVSPVAYYHFNPPAPHGTGQIP